MSLPPAFVQDQKFLFYKIFTIILPASILLTTAFIEVIQRNVPLFPVLFRMVRIKKRKFYCYDIDLASPPQAKRVSKLMKWMTRVVVGVVWAYLWEALILESLSILLARKDIRQEYCRAGYDCFEVRPLATQLTVPWKGSTNACIENKTSGEELEDEKKVVGLCFRFPHLPFGHVVTSLASGFAISGLMLVSYDCLVWLMLYDRTEKQIWTRLCQGSTAITLLAWIALLVSKALFAATTWIGESALLCIPSILYIASSTASALRLQRQINSHRPQRLESNHPLLSSSYKKRDDSDQLPYNLPPSVCDELDEVFGKIGGIRDFGDTDEVLSRATTRAGTSPHDSDSYGLSLAGKFQRKMKQLAAYRLPNRRFRSPNKRCASPTLRTKLNGIDYHEGDIPKRDNGSEPLLPFESSSLFLYNPQDSPLYLKIDSDESQSNQSCTPKRYQNNMEINVLSRNIPLVKDG